MSKKRDLVMHTLEETGLLLLSDSCLPSLVGLIVGEPVKGSWWGHPKGQEIYGLAESLDDDPALITTKLLSGKVTFVHEKFWSHLLAIDSAKEKWQTSNLSEDAERLLKLIIKSGSVKSNVLSKDETSGIGKVGKACDELEKRLLVYTEQFHSETGAHARLMESWDTWSQRRKFNARKLTSEEAKADLEELVAGLNQQFKGKAKLPWQ